MGSGVHKIGVLGGTFDPVHMGHLILAQSAYEELSLEKVLFIPSGRPPHKPVRSGGASDFDRLEMTRLAIASNPAFELSDMEMNSKEPTYSYLTLKKLHDSHPDNEYYFILGEDSLVDFRTWRNPGEIVKHCRVVVGVRPGSSDEKIEKIIDRTRAELGGEYIHIKSPALEISSHDIRSRVRMSKSVRYFIPPEVAGYIGSRGLYRNTENMDSGAHG